MPERTVLRPLPPKPIRVSPGYRYSPAEVKQELDRWKKEYEAGSRFAAANALQFCRHTKQKKIPDWILDGLAIPALQSAINDIKKQWESKRWQQKQQDKNIYRTVLDFKESGMTWNQAYEKAAMVAGISDGTRLTPSRTKGAYIRVRRLQKAGKLV